MRLRLCVLAPHLLCCVLRVARIHKRKVTPESLCCFCFSPPNYLTISCAVFSFSSRRVALYALVETTQHLLRDKAKSAVYNVLLYASTVVCVAVHRRTADCRDKSTEERQIRRHQHTLRSFLSNGSLPLLPCCRRMVPEEEATITRVPICAVETRGGLLCLSL